MSNLYLKVLPGMMFITAALACSTYRPTPPPPAPQRNEPPQARPNDAPQPPPNDAPPRVPNEDPNLNETGDDDASFLVGTWTMRSQISGMQCTSELIFERTGTYSGLATCDNGFGGTYMTRSVGDWTLIKSGMVRIHYTGHEPKVYGGREIRYPDGETMTYTVRDRNHLETQQGVLTRKF